MLLGLRHLFESRIHYLPVGLEIARFKAIRVPPFCHHCVVDESKNVRRMCRDDDKLTANILTRHIMTSFPGRHPAMAREDHVQLIGLVHIARSYGPSPALQNIEPKTANAKVVNRATGIPDS